MDSDFGHQTKLNKTNIIIIYEVFDFEFFYFSLSVAFSFLSDTRGGDSWGWERVVRYGASWCEVEVMFFHCL